MTLARYTDTYWYPSGQIAGNVPASIFPASSSAPAALWANSAGTIPLTNPLPTTGTGLLDFWAESGEYWIHLDTETFPVTIGMSQEQSDLSTGIASGGEINVNAVNPLAIDIGATDGYIVDYLAGTQSQPVVTRVKTLAQTVALDAAALLRSLTWWLLDSTGAVLQRPTRPTNEERRTHLVLGATAQNGVTIYVDQTLPVILPQPVNQLVDLMDSLGAFLISGGDISPNGANQKINQSAGVMFSRAFNHFAGPALTNNPHVASLQAQAPSDFRYATQSTVVFGPTVTDVDVANYDNGGVITPIGGGANTSSIHRVWLFPTNTVPEQMVIQYGQTTYPSMAAALDRLGQTGHIPNPILPEFGALAAYIVATRTATNLSDPAQALIIKAAKFDAP